MARLWHAGNTGTIRRMVGTAPDCDSVAAMKKDITFYLFQALLAEHRQRTGHDSTVVEQKHCTVCVCLKAAYADMDRAEHEGFAADCDD